jgi:hypothetical protein
MGWDAMRCDAMRCDAMRSAAWLHKLHFWPVCGITFSSTSFGADDATSGSARLMNVLEWASMSDGLEGAAGSGSVVQWRSGAAVQWRSGAAVQWRSGAAVQW